MSRLRATELRDGVLAGPGFDPDDVAAAGDRPAGVVGALHAPDRAGRRQVEVVVDGWRFAFVVEDADRADLRARATRDGGGGPAASGPLEIRAIIPGRVAAVAVVEGDEVTAGQPLLTVEAMKMQNELTAPRDGRVTRVGTAAGSTIEIGDLLVVIS